MSNSKIMWLSHNTENFYDLWEFQPKLNRQGVWRDGEILVGFCGEIFIRLCPTLKLRKRTVTKIRLTQLKNGIKLEKI